MAVFHFQHLALKLSNDPPLLVRRIVRPPLCLPLIESTHICPLSHVTGSVEL